MLPPPQAWHDPSIVKGSSEWRPFRKPSDGESKTAGAKAPGETKATAAAGTRENPGGAAGSPDAEKEIRNLVADFNAALAENKLDEASEFLTDAQAQASGDVFAAVHQLVEQLRLLQVATPALREKIDGLVPLPDHPGAIKQNQAQTQQSDSSISVASWIPRGIHE